MYSGKTESALDLRADLERLALRAGACGCLVLPGFQVTMKRSRCTPRSRRTSCTETSSQKEGSIERKHSTHESVAAG